VLVSGAATSAGASVDTGASGCAKGLHALTAPQQQSYGFFIYESYWHHLTVLEGIMPAMIPRTRLACDINGQSTLLSTLWQPSRRFAAQRNTAQHSANQTFGRIRVGQRGIGAPIACDRWRRLCYSVYRRSNHPPGAAMTLISAATLLMAASQLAAGRFYAQTEPSSRCSAAR